MTERMRQPSREEIEACADRDGRPGRDPASGIGLARDTRTDPLRDRGGEAESPPDNTLPSRGKTAPSGAFAEAIDRATAAVGDDSGAH